MKHYKDKAFFSLGIMLTDILYTKNVQENKQFIANNMKWDTSGPKENKQPTQATANLILTFLNGHTTWEMVLLHRPT